MAGHDIIDNRKIKLVDNMNNMNKILSPTESARLAVGYFFPSGLTLIAQQLGNLKRTAPVNQQHRQPRNPPRL